MICAVGPLLDVGRDKESGIHRSPAQGTFAGWGSVEEGFPKDGLFLPAASPPHDAPDRPLGLIEPLRLPRVPLAIPRALEGLGTLPGKRGCGPRP